jgi:hypothetical protein
MKILKNLSHKLFYRISIRTKIVVVILGMAALRSSPTRSTGPW